MQVLNIRSFWIHHWLSQKELKLRKPKISEGQFMLMLTKPETGHVLTTNGNLYTGWGEVYKVFDDLKSARNYGLDQQGQGFECSIFDVRGELLETMR